MGMCYDATMGLQEDFLALFANFAAQKPTSPKPIANMKEHLTKEHEEMMRLLNNEEALTRELTRNNL
jgi:hypothetical protein